MLKYGAGKAIGMRTIIILLLALGLAIDLYAQTLSAALDGTGLVWTTGGSAVWTGQTVVTHDGVDAAASGAITANQQSWVQTTVSGPGTIAWWWQASSEMDYDFLELRLGS